MGVTLSVPPPCIAARSHFKPPLWGSDSCVSFWPHSEAKGTLTMRLKPVACRLPACPGPTALAPAACLSSLLASAPGPKPSPSVPGDPWTQTNTPHTSFSPEKSPLNRDSRNEYHRGKSLHRMPRGATDRRACSSSSFVPRSAASPKKGRSKSVLARPRAQN